MGKRTIAASLSVFLLLIFVKQDVAFSKKTEPVISRINIEITGPSKKKDKLKALARELITLKKGMIFNGKDLARYFFKANFKFFPKNSFQGTH